MSKLRKSLSPYLPVRGVNLDNPSLFMADANCIDISNLRIKGSELRTRPGLSQVGESSSYHEDDDKSAAEMNNATDRFELIGDPHANAITILIFTNSSDTIWTMTERLSDNKLIDAFGAVMGSVDRAASPAEVIWTTWPKTAGGLTYNPDVPGGITNVQMIYNMTGDYPYPFRDDEYVVHMALHRDPDEGTTLFAFTNKGVYSYDDSTGDGLASFNVAMHDDLIGTFSAITFWSTTEFTDSYYGSTMVAAGSIPPSIASADETDGNSRVLLTYDRSVGKFIALEPRYEVTEIVYTFTGSEPDPSGTPLSMGPATLPPIDYGSVDINWYEGDYLWHLTAEAPTAGVSNLKDPDDNVCGTINVYTGAIQLDEWPENGAVAAAPAAGINVLIDYNARIYTYPRFVFNMNNRLLQVAPYNTEWDGVSDWEAVGTYRPWRVSWSDVQDIDRLNILLNWIDNVGVDTSSYVAGQYIGDMLILYRQNSIEQMFFVGGSSVFGFRTSVNHGLFAGNTVGLYKDLHFYMGKDNVYVYDGNTTKSIADKRVRDYILAASKNDSLDKFMSFVDNGEAEYWLLVATVSATFPTRAMVYNIVDDSWSIYDFPVGITAMQFRSEHFVKPLLATDTGYVTTLAVANKTDLWDVWDGSAWAEQSTPIAVLLETKDFAFAALEDLDRIQRVLFEANSDDAAHPEFKVSHSLDYGDTYSDPVSIELDDNPADRWYWIDYTTRKIRFKITSSDYFVMRYLQISGLMKEEK